VLSGIRHIVLLINVVLIGVTIASSSPAVASDAGINWTSQSLAVDNDCGP
jgi:hypothetical protein